MFEVEKPRRFHYQPRFYDPEKERWEALKKKYAIEQERNETAATKQSNTESGESEETNELQYFQQRVKDIDRQERERNTKLSWKDLFRKREMPQFNYQPRFSDNADVQQTDANTEDAKTIADKYKQPKRQIKIRRRFDISDTDYMKPVSGTKIIGYCFLVFLLLTLILKF